MCKQIRHLRHLRMREFYKKLESLWGTYIFEKSSFSFRFCGITINVFIVSKLHCGRMFLALTDEYRWLCLELSVKKEYIPRTFFPFILGSAAMWALQSFSQMVISQKFFRLQKKLQKRVNDSTGYTISTLLEKVQSWVQLVVVNLV